MTRGACRSVAVVAALFLLAPMLAQTSSPAPVFAGRMQGFYFDDLTQRGRQ